MYTVRAQSVLYLAGGSTASSNAFLGRSVGRSVGRCFVCLRQLRPNSSDTDNSADDDMDDGADSRKYKYIY